MRFREKLSGLRKWSRNALSARPNPKPDSTQPESLPVDSHQLLVRRAEEAAQNDGFAKGYTQGLAEGEKQLRESLEIEVDFSVAQQVLDRLLFEEPEPVYTNNAVDRALKLAVSWRRGRDMAFWQDVEKFLHREHRARMRKMRDGETHQAEILTLIEGLMALPEIAARVEAKYHGARNAGPEHEVIRRG